MTESEMLAIMAEISPEQLAEADAIGARVGEEMADIFREVDADRGKVAAFLHPWVLVDRLGIPRDHLTPEAEAEFREVMRAALNSDPGTCERCKGIVVAVVLGIVVAAFLITMLVAPSLARAVIQAAMRNGIITTVSVTTLAMAMVGFIAAVVGQPSCKAMGYCGG